MDEKQILVRFTENGKLVKEFEDFYSRWSPVSDVKAGNKTYTYNIRESGPMAITFSWHQDTEHPKFTSWEDLLSFSGQQVGCDYSAVEQF